jgi:hypothetical protein
MRCCLILAKISEIYAKGHNKYFASDNRTNKEKQAVK